MGRGLKLPVGSYNRWSVRDLVDVSVERFLFRIQLSTQHRALMVEVRPWAHGDHVFVDVRVLPGYSVRPFAIQTYPSGAPVKTYVLRYLRDSGLKAADIVTIGP